MRAGSKVSREGYDSLGEAIAAAREQVDRTRRGGRLGTFKGFRDYAPGERVQCRIEISGKGFFRGPEAGIDVMGDGGLVPYAGSMRKRELAADTLDEAMESIRSELEG